MLFHLISYLHKIYSLVLIAIFIFIIIHHHLTFLIKIKNQGDTVWKGCNSLRKPLLAVGEGGGHQMGRRVKGSKKQAT
jgi:hypothetical protein